VNDNYIKYCLVEVAVTSRILFLDTYQVLIFRGHLDQNPLSIRDNFWKFKSTISSFHVAFEEGLLFDGDELLVQSGFEETYALHLHYRDAAKDYYTKMSDRNGCSAA
jgi:hypothetical protein